MIWKCQNCHCKQTVTLTGVTVSNQACTLKTEFNFCPITWHLYFPSYNILTYISRNYTPTQGFSLCLSILMAAQVREREQAVKNYRPSLSLSQFVLHLEIHRCNEREGKHRYGVRERERERRHSSAISSFSCTNLRKLLGF